MGKEEGSAVAGTFWVFSPVVAITSSWNGKTNAQIAVTVNTASIVHIVPRLVVGIWKGNYTHELIINSKSMAIHLLRKDQLALVRELGFYTGRDRNKLGKIHYKIGLSGSPILDDAHSFSDCQVINAMDAGDMTTFLVNVIDGGIISGGDWMTLNYFYNAAPPEWIAEYSQKLARSIEFSLDKIHKINYNTWNP